MRRLIFYICFFKGCTLYAQVNLVIDPSFEVYNYDSCNVKLWIEACRYRHSLDSSNNIITSLTRCSPSYANTCTTYVNAAVPDNYFTGPLSRK